MSSVIDSKSIVGGFTPELFSGVLERQTSSPQWWSQRKRAAFEKFSSLPTPSRRDESWRFSNLAGIGMWPFGPNVVAPIHVGGNILPPWPFFPLMGGAIRSGQAATPFGPASAEMHFGNGQLSARYLHDQSLAATGVQILTLEEAAASHREILTEHFLAQPQKLGSAKFAALHAAMVQGGAFIYIPKGVEVSAPIVITHFAKGDDVAVFPHTLIIAEENSSVTVVEHFASADGGRHFALGANDLYAGHGARLNYVAAQRWSESTLSFQLNSTVVRRDARVQSLNLHLGGRQARHESLSQLQAPGAFSEMLALTVAGGTQEFDQRTLQIHQAPNTKSDLLYKNALRDKSRTIFSGLIVVDADAQKTDAYQSNRNLMLSDDAEANSLPGLEIQANDVRCTHGATTTRIDPEQEFYLRARGITPKAADELLTFGFFEEVLLRLENESVRDALRTFLQEKFSSGSATNR